MVVRLQNVLQGVCHLIPPGEAHRTDTSIERIDHPHQDVHTFLANLHTEIRPVEKNARSSSELHELRVRAYQRLCGLFSFERFAIMLCWSRRTAGVRRRCRVLRSRCSAGLRLAALMDFSRRL